MKIFLVGEAANHKEELISQLVRADGIEVAALPAEAALSPVCDAAIRADDVLVTLRYSRKPGEIPSFRMLHVPGAGLDGIDKASLPQGCILCNVYEHQTPIAEYVMLAMLEWEIRFSAMCGAFDPERWSETYCARTPHGELFAKTIGLIGFGGIGRAVAKRARAFGMRVMAVDKFASDDEGLADMLVKNERINEVLQEADFVVITCPLTEETFEWIDEDRIGQMKRSAVLINISRGNILSQKDVYVALAEKRIAGAVLDVWWRYPKNVADAVLPADYPFHALDNVFCTPHSCAWTKELTLRRYGVIAKNIENLRDGRPLLNLVGNQ